MSLKISEFEVSESALPKEVFVIINMAIASDNNVIILNGTKNDSKSQYLVKVRFLVMVVLVKTERYGVVQ